MSTFRQNLIQKLAERGVDEESIADSLAHVIKGERVKRVFGVNNKGDIQLSGVEIVTTPKDAAQGALLYDALRGGDLGLAPREARRTHAVGDLHKRFAPPVDERIVPVNNFFQHPVPDIATNPPSPTSSSASPMEQKVDIPEGAEGDVSPDVLAAIAFQPPSEPEDGEF